MKVKGEKYFNEIMRFFITILCALFFISCSAAEQPVKPVNADGAIIEKNKQIAVLNEVGKITREAQYLEKLGRDMEIYRRALDAEARRSCNDLMELRLREVTDLEARIQNLSGNYNDRLSSIINDLKPCVSCSKKSIDGCVKTRASLNKMIKELYP